MEGKEQCSAREVPQVQIQLSLNYNQVKVYKQKKLNILTSSFE